MAYTDINKPVISKIKFPSGQTYYIKDAEARDAIDALGSPTHFAGQTSTDVRSNPTTNPVTVDEAQYNAHAGDIVVYGNGEFIWDGSKWIEFGDLSNLGQLAYKDNVVLSKGSGDNVLGEDTTFTAADSTVSFGANAGSDFVTGFASEAVAPTFTEGAFDAGSLPTFSEGAFTPASFGEGFYTPGTVPTFSEGAFSAGTLPSFTEGAFTPASIAEGFVTAGSAASYSHSGFDGGSLGAASTSAFAEEGILAAMGSGEDAETLIFSNASTANAVTAQGTFTPATYGTDTFNGGTPTAVDVTKFNGGSKAADTFSAGSLPSKAADSFNAGAHTALDLTKFNGGSKAADTFGAGTLPSKAADTFNAGSAATLATAKALTAADTGTAAAQAITAGANDKVKVAGFDDLSVSVTNN